MGLSSSKTTTGPSKQAMPYLKTASSAVQGAYDANKDNLADISGALGQQFRDFSSTMGDSLTGAKSYNSDVLGGKYLTGNPQLDAIIGQTNDSVTDRVNAIFSRSGQTGSSRQIGELGKQLSDNESRLRYSDYDAERARMAAAVSAALGINSAENQNAQTASGLGTTAATLPYAGASFLADGLGGLWGNSQTTKSSPGLGQMLLGAASNAATAWAGGGFG